jgi:hypothetical protein
MNEISQIDQKIKIAQNSIGLMNYYKGYGELIHPSELIK